MIVEDAPTSAARLKEQVQPGHKMKSPGARDASADNGANIRFLAFRVCQIRHPDISRVDLLAPPQEQRGKNKKRRDEALAGR